MTEYDYSPEAYERFMATQNRIAKWVDTTQQHQPRNPFTPSTPAPPTFHQPLPRHIRSSSRHRDDNRSHHSRDSRHRDRDRDLSPSASGSGRHGPPRPRTAPPREDIYGQQYPQHSKHSNSQYSLASRAQTPRHTRSRSSSQHTSSTARPPPLRSQTYMAPPPLPTRHPVRSNTSPIVAYPGRSPLVVDTGTSYVVVPPKGKHIEVVSPQTSYYSGPKPFAVYHSPLPTKPQPLIKRLFSGFTGGSKNSGSSRRSRRSSF